MCLAPPLTGPLGNSGPFELEGPGYNNQNVSIAKTFNLAERFRFTFTASASDAFNHPSFYLPAANISVPGGVGRISSMVDGAASRQVELRGRLQF